MITDEISYYFQALNWLGGNINNTIIDAVSGTTYSLIEGHYPPGTSFILSTLYCISNSLIYFSGLLYFIGSILILHKCLNRLQLPLVALSVFYFFVPLIVIARTTMSEMPSLLLVSIGVYLYFSKNQKSYILLAFITGLSIAFRETNLLLLAPFAFFSSRNYFYSSAAFLTGFSFRLIGYFILTSNPIYVKEGYPFGIEFIPETLIIYGFVLLVLLPLSPLWFTKVPRKHLLPFLLAIISFLLLHLVYGYLAHVYSGYANGVLLNGRFWIPALPIFVIAMGYFTKDLKWFNNAILKSIIILFLSITTVSIHYKSSQKNSEFEKMKKILESASVEQLTFIDMDNRTPIFRYIYPFVRERKWSDINLLNNEYHMEEAFKKFGDFQVAIISTTATVSQSNRSVLFNAIVLDLKEKYIVDVIKRECPSINSCLQIYRISQK